MRRFLNQLIIATVIAVVATLPLQLRTQSTARSVRITGLVVAKVERTTVERATTMYSSSLCRISSSL